MNRFIAALLSFAAVLASSPPARADTFPSKPVTIVVPFAPGGSSDAISRIVAQELGKKWKQSVLIDNRAGGQTIVGSSFAARAPADGYTILYVSYAWTTNQFLVKNLPYQPSELTPLTLLGRYPLALFVKGDMPAQSLAEFVALAKKSPRPLAFGNAGVGSSSHLAALDFADSVGIKIISVPYKSGTIGAINDLLGGQIDALFEGRTFKQFADDKRLKALVIAQPQRMSNWQDLPSAAESGYPALDVAGYFGLMLQAKTPKQIQDQIYADVADVLRGDQVRERFAQLGLLPVEMTPAQFGSFLQSQHDKLGALVARHRDQMTE